ncbi:MAG: NAD(P)/FAD-dependent oxidoreductase [Actinomycetota bacterium]
MRIVIVGGGSVGTFAARELQGPLERMGHELVLVNPENFMQYQSLLPEAAAGNIEPRHVVVPLRQALRKTRLIVGEARSVDHERRVVHVMLIDGGTIELSYEVLILAPGSRSRTLPIPGLADRAVGFKTVAEAIFLRNHILSRLDVAAEATDPEQRRAALTFVFVGAGYAGVEAIAELEDLARAATRYVPSVSRADMRWVLVEAGPAILPEIGPALAGYAARVLARRGIEVFTDTRLESAEFGTVRLSNERSWPAHTLVWTAGVTPEPLALASGLPVDGRHRIVVDGCMRVQGLADVWAAGDAAAVPDPDSPGGFSPPTAQHAVRQGKRLGKNVLAVLSGKEPSPFRYKTLGSLASLGRYRGVARVLGVRLRGFPAWFVARSYHLWMIPTPNRKARIVVDWTFGLLFSRDMTQLGSLQAPRAPFARAVGDAALAPPPRVDPEPDGAANLADVDVDRGEPGVADSSGGNDP